MVLSPQLKSCIRSVPPRLDPTSLCVGCCGVFEFFSFNILQPPPFCIWTLPLPLCPPSFSNLTFSDFFRKPPPFRRSIPLPFCNAQSRRRYRIGEAGPPSAPLPSGKLRSLVVFLLFILLPTLYIAPRIAPYLLPPSPGDLGSRRVNYY